MIVDTIQQWVRTRVNQLFSSGGDQTKETRLDTAYELAREASHQAMRANDGTLL